MSYKPQRVIDVWKRMTDVVTYVLFSTRLEASILCSPRRVEISASGSEPDRSCLFAYLWYHRKLYNADEQREMRGRKQLQLTERCLA
mgnify:CR=1 FL=1